MGVIFGGHCATLRGTKVFWREMKQIKFLTFLVYLFTSLSTLAQDVGTLSLTCETPRQSYIFQVQEESVSFMLPIYDKGKISRRFPASNAATIASVRGQEALEVITYFETRRFKIFVDLKNESFEGSTVSIRTRDGHEMTSPLTCEKL